MKAGTPGDWSELLKSDKLNAWTRVQIQECYHEVRQDDDERRSIVQQILHKSQNILGRVVVPADCRTCVLTVIGIRLKTASCWFRRGTATTSRSGKSNATGGAGHAVASTIGGTQTESWFFRTARTAARRRRFGAHALPQGVCENLLKALTLSSQISRREVTVLLRCTSRGLPERSRVKMMEELRRVHQGGEPRGGEHWPLGKDLGVTPCS